MELIIESLDKIDFAAKNFLSNFKNQYFAFYGEIGAGKTTFIKALCKYLGVTDNINSPTFSIVNEYFSKKNGIIYHFDFFRINKIEEVLDIGFEEYLYSCDYCFIEWPEIIETILPDNFLKLKIIEMDNKARKIIPV